MREVKKPPFGEPVGPWTHHHWLGAAVVAAIMLALASGFWPGWQGVG